MEQIDEPPSASQSPSFFIEALGGGARVNEGDWLNGIYQDSRGLALR